MCEIGLFSKAEPILKPGVKYTVCTKSYISVDNKKADCGKISKDFYINQEDDYISDSQIHSIFPPRGGRGDFGNYLPYIVFKDKTLPWKRQFRINDDILPWFVILVLPEGSNEKTDPDKRELTIPFNDIFKNNMPEINDLRYLAHVRKVDISNKVTGEENMGDEFSCILGNRFIKSGFNRAYLIEVEELKDYFDGKVNPKETIKVKYLYNWAFFCEDNQKFGIRDFMENPGTRIDTLKTVTEDNSVLKDYANLGYVPIRHYLFNGDRTISWYRGPFCPVEIEEIEFSNSSFATEKVVFDKKSGMLDVSYSTAWQLGKLLALSDNEFASELLMLKRHKQNKSNERLVKRKNENEYNFYNAGVLFEKISNNLEGHYQCTNGVGRQNYSLKKSNDIDSQVSLLGNALNTLKEIRNADNKDDEYEDLSNYSKDKLRKWSIFYDVPFEWLCPNVNVLTDESCCMFKVDNNWLNSFLDGAMSIGRDSKEMKAKDYIGASKKIKEAVQTNHRIRAKMLNNMRGIKDILDYDCSLNGVEGRLSEVDSVMSGILINSRMITDNPGLEVHVFASDDDSRELKIVRMERIKPSLLLCIVSGDQVLRKVMFDTPAESLHFGCDNKGQISLIDYSDYTVTDIAVKLKFRGNEEARTNYEKGCIDFKSSINSIMETYESKDIKKPDEYTSADFALGLTVNRVRGEINFGKKDIFGCSYESSGVTS